MLERFSSVKARLMFKSLVFISLWDLIILSHYRSNHKITVISNVLAELE